MNWVSVEDVIEEFDLSASPTDLTAVEDEIRARMVVNHPDQTGGEFRDGATRAAFHRLSEASDWLKRYRKNATTLIPIQHLPALVESIHALSWPARDDRVRALSNAARADARESRRSALRFPRISSSALAAISAFFAAFPERLIKIIETLQNRASLPADHIQNERILVGSFLAMAVMAGVLFCLTWLWERIEEERVEAAMSSPTRDQLFRDLLQGLKRDENGRSIIQFSERQFVDIVEGYLNDPRSVGYFLRPLRFIFRSRRSPAVAEKIAASHLESLESRSLISRVQSKVFTRLTRSYWMWFQKPPNPYEAPGCQ